LRLEERVKTASANKNYLLDKEDRQIIEIHEDVFPKYIQTIPFLF